VTAGETEALIEQDRALRADADALLQRHGVLEILREFGRPHISGSYALRLMTWRDLDIYLEMPALSEVEGSELRVDRFLELGRRLATAIGPRKASFTDHLHFPATENVPGLYWGIHTDILSRGGWKIDVWGVTADTCAQLLRRAESIAVSVNAETRAAILSIKNEVCRHPRYRDTITSQHIYDAVLSSGVRTLDEFWRHIGDRRD
jgi:hypothetical protein